MVARTFDAINFRVADNTQPGSDGDVTWFGFYQNSANSIPLPSDSLASAFKFDVPADMMSDNLVTVTVEDTNGSTNTFEDEAPGGPVSSTASENQTILGGSSSPIAKYSISDGGQVVGTAYLVVRDVDGIEESTNGTSSHADWDAGDDYFLAIDFNGSLTMSDFAGTKIFFVGFGSSIVDGDGTFD